MLEDKNLKEQEKEMIYKQAQINNAEKSTVDPQLNIVEDSAVPVNISQPTLYKAEHPQKVTKEYQINSKNVE